MVCRRKDRLDDMTWANWRTGPNQRSSFGGRGGVSDIVRCMQPEGTTLRPVERILLAAISERPRGVRRADLVSITGLPRTTVWSAATSLITHELVDESAAPVSGA